MARRRGVRLGLTAACAAAVTLGVVTGAHALWSIDDTVVIPAIQTGGVSFAASTQSAPELVYSSDGGPVSVTLPGSEIVKVLDQTGIDPAPVIWTFQATGWAHGITGLVYDVALTEQVALDGTTYGLSSGVAEDDTVLHFSTIKVYPASVNGDCSSVPETPEPGEDGAKNVYVYDAEDHVLQAPGAYPGGAVTQTWCVAMDFNNEPDGVYVNDVRASGTADDGSSAAALDSWQAAVAFPPSLPGLGEYYNKALVWGVADDLTISRDEDEWGAKVYPDPANEPSVTIALDPAVTNQNPAVTQPSDAFELASE